MHFSRVWCESGPSLGVKTHTHDPHVALIVTSQHASSKKQHEKELPPLLPVDDETRANERTTPLPETPLLLLPHPPNYYVRVHAPSTLRTCSFDLSFPLVYTHTGAMPSIFGLGGSGSGGSRSGNGRGGNSSDAGPAAASSSTRRASNEQLAAVQLDHAAAKVVKPVVDGSSSNVVGFRLSAPPPVVTRTNVPDNHILFQGWVTDERREDAKPKRCVFGVNVMVCKEWLYCCLRYGCGICSCP